MGFGTFCHAGTIYVLKRTCTERSRSFIKVIIKVTELSSALHLLVINMHKNFDVDAIDSFITKEAQSF